MGRFFKRRHIPTVESPQTVGSERSRQAEQARLQFAIRLLKHAINQAVEQYNAGQPNPRYYQVSLLDGRSLGDSSKSQVQALANACQAMEDQRVENITVSPTLLLGPLVEINLNTSPPVAQ